MKSNEVLKWLNKIKILKKIVEIKINLVKYTKKLRKKILEVTKT